MTKSELKSVLGLYLVLSHFSVILMVLLSPLYGMLFEQAMQLITIIAPLFAAYSTAVIKEAVIHGARSARKSPKVTVSLAIFSFLLPSLLTFSIVALFLMFNRSWVPMMTFDQLKYGVASLEVIFGIYVGIIVDSLFREGRQTGAASG